MYMSSETLTPPLYISTASTVLQSPCPNRVCAPLGVCCDTVGAVTRVRFDAVADQVVSKSNVAIKLHAVDKYGNDGLPSTDIDLRVVTQDGAATILSGGLVSVTPTGTVSVFNTRAESVAFTIGDPSGASQAIDISDKLLVKFVPGSATAPSNVCVCEWGGGSGGGGIPPDRCFLCYGNCLT